jgi:hypothetical protein
MFDRDQPIAKWRQQLVAAGMTTPEVLDELESHLREEIQRLSKSGKTSQEAFGTAVQNLGTAPALKNEFGKIKDPISIVERLMIGISVFLVIFIVLLSGLAAVLCYAHWAERLVVAAAVVSILIVACSWRKVVPFLPLISNAGARWAAGLACIASGIIASSLFCNFILPRFEIGPDRQLPAVGVWAVFLIAVFSCLGVGLLSSERERTMWGMVKAPVQGMKEH